VEGGGGAGPAPFTALKNSVRSQKLIQNWTSHHPHAMHFQTEDIYSTSQLCSVHCSRWPQFLWKIFI